MMRSATLPLIAVLMAVAACSGPTGSPPAPADGFVVRTAEAGLLPDPDLSEITQTITGAAPDAQACNAARQTARQAIRDGHASSATVAAARAREACPEALWRAFVPEACSAVSFGCADLQR